MLDGEAMERKGHLSSGAEGETFFPEIMVYNSTCFIVSTARRPLFKSAYSPLYTCMYVIHDAVNGAELHVVCNIYHHNAATMIMLIRPTSYSCLKKNQSTPRDLLSIPRLWGKKCQNV